MVERLTRDDLFKAGFIRVIEDCVDRFTNEAFLQKGLQDFIDGCQKRGHKATFDTYDVLTYEIAGRVVVTIQGNRGKRQITLITTDKADWEARKDSDPDEKWIRRMGIQSIDAEYVWAMEALMYLCEHLVADHKHFKCDEKVSLA